MIKPINDKLLIRPIGTSTETASGLLIPDADKKDKFLEKGIVIKLGPNVYNSIKENNTVYYGRWAGTPVNLNGEDFLMMKEEDIAGYEN